LQAVVLRLQGRKFHKAAFRLATGRAHTQEEAMRSTSRHRSAPTPAGTSVGRIASRTGSARCRAALFHSPPPASSGWRATIRACRSSSATRRATRMSPRCGRRPRSWLHDACCCRPMRRDWSPKPSGTASGRSP